MSFLSGTRKSVLVTVGLCMVIGVAAHVWSGMDHGALKVPAVVRIGTASPGGAYSKLGKGLAAMANEELGVSHVTAIETDGSVDNVERLGARGLEIAFVQSDAPLRDDVTTMAKLYDEVLHVVVNLSRFETPPKTIADLDGKQLAIGPKKSGTRAAVKRLLDDYDIAFRDSVDEGELPSTDAAREAFENGEIDAIFILAGRPSDVVSALLERGDTALLAVDDPKSEGYRLQSYINNRTTGYKSVDLLPGDYKNHPAKSLNTISVTALLVARRDLEDAFVREITRILFDRKSDLSRRYHITAKYIGDTASLLVQPYVDHPGAAAYYAKEPASLVAQYGRLAGLIVAGLAYLLAVVVSLREWSRLRRAALVREHATGGRGAGREASDVFIAYSTQSKPSEAAVARMREALEANDISYFYAPEKIKAGDDWASRIPDAIRNTRHALILVFSAAADESEHCQREVGLASEAKLKIMPYFVENVEPTGRIHYHMAHVQRIQAFEGAPEAHLGSLCRQLLKLKRDHRSESQPTQELADGSQAPAVAAPEAADVSVGGAPKKAGPRRGVPALVGLAAVSLAAIAFLWQPWRSGAPSVKPKPMAPAHGASQIGGALNYTWTFADHAIGVEYEVERFGADGRRRRARAASRSWPESESDLVGSVHWRVRALLPSGDGSLKPTEWSDTVMCTYYGNTLQKILDTARVVVAVSEDSYNYLDPSGTPTNLEIELIRLALQEQLDQQGGARKLDLVRRHIPWGSGLFNSLQDAEIDMMASAITIKPERESRWKVRFSDPVVRYYQAFVHLADQEVCAGKASGKAACRIGVKRSTTNHALATRLAGQEAGVHVVPFDQDNVYMVMFNALLKGDCELILLDEPFAVRIRQDAAKQSTTLKVTPVDEAILDAPPVENIGIGLKRTDESLRAVINQAIVSHEKALEQLKATLQPMGALR